MLAIIKAMRQRAIDIERDSSPAPLWREREPFGQRPALLGACCEALLSIGQPAYPPAVRGLQHWNRWVRYGCAWVLGRLGNKEAVLPLCAILEKKSENVNVVCQVAESLELLGEPRSAAYAERALRTMPMTPSGFYALAKLLAKIDPAASSRWCHILGKKTQPRRLREVAARVSGMLADSATAILLQNLLTDEHGTARAEAARSLGKRQVKAAEALLLSLATKASENAGVRVHAAWALARVGNDTGKKVLEEIATKGPGFAKSQAKESLDALAAGRSENLPTQHRDPKKFGMRFLDLGGGSFASVD